MGSVDEVKSCKTEKASPSAPADQANAHAYPPDRAAMQAYYGTGVPLPPYYNSAVGSGHAPRPYMWIPPQHMMPPFGPPYAAMYPHGGVYAHPATPLAETPLVAEAPAKSSVDTGRSSKKKSKGYDGLAISIGNGSAESKKQASDHDLSQSTETDVSSDGSGGNMKRMDQTGKKGGIEGTFIAEGSIVAHAKTTADTEKNTAPDKVSGNDISPSSVIKRKAGAVFSPSLGTPLELTSPSSMNTKTNSSGALQTSAALLSDGRGQNERDLKRERRKQSNRESARRSRLRKQAEAEELAVKVEALTAENLTLKAEMNQLTESSKKLKLENAMLMEKLKLVRLGQTEVMVVNKSKIKRSQPLSTENLLSRVNNSSSIHLNHEDEEKTYETSSKSNTKLRQLMDAKPMASTVAAG